MSRPRILKSIVQTTVLAIVADTNYVTERIHHTLPKATDIYDAAHCKSESHRIADLNLR